jgi:hypothetical protein
MSAVSHEIRNLSGAARVMYENLDRVSALLGNEDFEALGTLIHGMDVRSSASRPTAGGAMIGSAAGIARQNEIEGRGDVLARRVFVHNSETRSPEAYGRGRMPRC